MGLGTAREPNPPRGGFGREAQAGGLQGGGRGEQDWGTPGRPTSAADSYGALLVYVT